MEEKIKKECKLAGIDPNILTDEEKKELAEEIKQKEKGFCVQDGVLSDPSIMFRQ